MRRLAVAGMTVLLSACATRRPETILPTAPVAQSVIWRIEEGDLLKTRVFGHSELDADPTVSPTGTAFFPGLGRVQVLGLTTDSLEVLLNAQYAAQVVRGAAVQVTMQRELTLVGAARLPGVYAASPGLTILSFVARSGGQISQGEVPPLRLEKADGSRYLLPREARLGSIDIHRNDALVVAEQGFFQRNQAFITGASLVVNMISTLVGVTLLVSR